MKISKNHHHVFRILYHFVWIPKYRRKVFSEPYRTDLINIVKKAAYDYDMEVIEIEVLTDHIHAMVHAQPRHSPSEIMQIIKSISAREFFNLRDEIKQKLFWGGKLWTSSFYVETVGNHDEKAVREYVQNQLKEIDRVEKQLKLF